MAGLGATVIKVEEPGGGDPARRYGPFPWNNPGAEASGLFLYLNASKSGITLNLHTERGLAVFKELVRRSDVFVVNHPRRMVGRLGIGYRSLRKINPALVYVSITPFGSSGPARHRKGNNLIAFHSGGMASFTPDWVEDRETMPPLQAGGHQADFAAGIVGAMAALGALYGRTAGRGCLVDISEQEVVAFALARSIAFYSYEGIRQDRKKQSRTMEGPVPCRDGYVEFHVVEDSHWQAFREVIGNPGWSARPEFQTYVDRCRNWKALERNLVGWTVQHTRQEIYHLMQAHRVAFGPVNTAVDVLQSPQTAARGYFTDIEHTVAGKLKYPGPPFKLSGAPPSRPAPLLGQHNREVYEGMLGMPAEELADLQRAGIV